MPGVAPGETCLIHRSAPSQSESRAHDRRQTRHPAPADPRRGSRRHPGRPLAPGHRLPNETDMALHYRVSRMTVNKALGQLTRDGYLDRRRKGGTFVARPLGRSAVMEIAAVADEVQATGATYGFRLIARQVRPATKADRADIGTGGPLRLLALETLHLADATPFCHESRLISLAAVPTAETADFAQEPAGPWLLRQQPWSSAEHLIRAVTPTAALARSLGIPATTACLQIDRRTEFEGQPITFARLTYPGALHQLAARFSPAGEPQP
ncbi:MAG: UTRA domain-containing protein [Paracoccaceae bacterium]